MSEPGSALAGADVDNLIALRRQLHAHPELGDHEVATTALIVETLTGLGLRPSVLPAGTGVICELGPGDGPVIGLRADIDALPITDIKDVSYRSRNEGVCHACGHDAHTAILLGAAAQLTRRELPGRIRLIFQPAEETLPGGALSVIAAGGLTDVRQIFALHCDPRLPAGQVGLRVGPITAASDHFEVRLRGPGGHTARPHLTVDLVYALGLVITGLPALLSRRVDVRAGLLLVWGSVEAGRAANAIPAEGVAVATLRVADREAWDGAEALVRELVAQLAAPTGAEVDVHYQRGMPPVVNDAAAVAVQQAAVRAALGPGALAPTPQSMGAEDFAWYLEQVPGSLARLGVAAPGRSPFDLHQAGFDIDETALEVGVRYTVGVALEALTAIG